MAQRIPINTGEVHCINHTLHTGTSKNTLKSWHYGVVITNNGLLSRVGYPLVSFIPMTSMKMKYWNNEEGHVRYKYHHIITPKKYTILKNETVILCDQIFTCDYDCLQDAKFSLDKLDLIEIRKRVSYVLGYSNHNF